MLVVHVHCRAKLDLVAEFREACLANARESIKEQGVLRFDVLQQADDPQEFILQEVYRDTDAAAAHKQTEHYAAWRDAAEDLLAEQRYSLKFAARFPTAPESWDTVAP